MLMFIIACNGKKESINKFSDPEILHIADLQDRRMSDSLFLYFSNENKQYRKEAALAFASLQDTLAIDQLSKVLKNDKDAEVREAAAFALGQTGTEKSFYALLESALSEKNESVLIATIEACGKTASSEGAIQLVKSQKENIEEAFAWSYYQLGLRGINNPEITEAAYKLLASPNEKTRLAAAHYFSRTSVPNFTDAISYLRKVAVDQNVSVRIAATQALRNIKTDSARIVLVQNTKDADERVRVNAIRALRSFAFADVAPTFFEALTDSSLQVRVATAEALTNFANKTSAPKIFTAAQAATDWRVQASLFEIAASLNPQPSLFETIKLKYEAATNNYQKAALLNVLGKSATNYGFIGKELINTSDPIVLSSAALALTSCNSASDFSETEKPTFLKLYKQAIEKADAAVTGIIAQVLGDSTKNYKPLLSDITFLKKAKENLSLPKDNEAMQPVEAAIAYLEGQKPTLVKNDFNHPLNWALIKSIPPNQSAIIKTTKGDIAISLFVEEAPGSVSNFVMLTNQNYFDNKFFHRVVPNFVIQAGCNRGDGWGSEDYSIRSEFTPRKYKEGSIGMASAGKDTEGTQWFISHSPTPHLNGRYTIFAEVTKGMEVVNAIEVGDKILDVMLINQK